MLECYEKLVINRIPGTTAIGTKTDKKDPKMIAYNAIESEIENVHVSDESSSDEAPKAENRPNKLLKRKPWDIDETFPLTTNQLQRFVLNE